MAMTSTQQLEAYRFFAVAFDAAPGVTYMSQLAEAYASGMTTEQIVEVYTTKAEFLSIYPSFYTNSQFATKLVDRVVDSSASATAKAEAVADIEAALAAGWSQGKVIYTIFQNLASKDPTDATWGATATLMANQVAVAKYYTEEQLGDSTSVSTLQSVISAVTATSDVSSTTAIASLITSGVSPTTSQTFTLTTGADVINGGAGDDTITGNIGGISSSDEIHGGAGNDTMTVKIDNLTANSTAYAPVVDGVETITLEARNASATFFLTNVSGATTLNVKGITNLAVSDLANSGAINVTNGYSADLTLAIATNTATAQAFTVNLNDASGADILIDADQSTTAQDVLTLNAVTNWGHGSATTFSGMEKVVLKGDGSINLNLASAVAGGLSGDAVNDLTAIDGSSMTGALTVTLDSKDINLKGGAGADVFRMTADLGTNDVLDGGAGADTLNAMAAGYLRPTITNLETINLHLSGAAATADFRDVSGAQTVNVLFASGTNPNLVLDKVGTALSTVNVQSGTSSANDLGVLYGTGAVASDVTLSLGNAVVGVLQTAAATASAMTIGDVNLSGNSGSLTVNVANTASYTVDSLTAADFTAVTIGAGSANLTLNSGAHLTNAQTVIVNAGAGKTATVNGLSAMVANSLSFNANGASAQVSLNTVNAGTANTVTILTDASMTGNVGFSADDFAFQSGAGATGALNLDTITINALGGDVLIDSATFLSGATSVNLGVNVNMGSTAVGVTIGSLALNSIASAATASEQSITLTLAGTGSFTLSTASIATANLTFKVNATALASGSNITMDLSDIDDTDSVVSAVFGAASGTFIGGDGADSIELGLGAMTVNGGGGADNITLNNTAAHRIEIYSAESTTDTLWYAGTGDNVLFLGATTASAAMSGDTGFGTGTATTTAQIYSAALTASITANTDASAAHQIAIYTANGDTYIETLKNSAVLTAAGATGLTAGDIVQIKLANKDFTAITAAFKLDTTGSGLQVTLL